MFFFLSFFLSHVIDPPPRLILFQSAGKLSFQKNRRGKSPQGEKVEKVGHLAVKLLKLKDDKIKFNLETDINGGRSLWLSGLQFTLAKVLPVCGNKPDRLDLRAGCNIVERSLQGRGGVCLFPRPNFHFTEAYSARRVQKFRLISREKTISPRYDNSRDARKMMN